MLRKHGRYGGVMWYECRDKVCLVSTARGIYSSMLPNDEISLHLPAKAQCRIVPSEILVSPA